MLGIHDFALFAASGILLNLTPGPDTAYILGRSIAQGRTAGLASAFGIMVGSIFHTGAAALGLSALLATSALAFTAIKFAGAIYLILTSALTLTQLWLEKWLRYDERGLSRRRRRQLLLAASGNG